MKIAPVTVPTLCMVYEYCSFSKWMTGGLLFGSNFATCSAIAVNIPALSDGAVPLAANNDKIKVFAKRNFKYYFKPCFVFNWKTYG